MSKVGLFITTQEQTELFKYYDKNQDGQISVVEFLQSLQDQMAEKRVRAVKSAFEYLDVNKTGCLAVNWLKEKFVPSSHPRVVTREKTTQMVAEEFENAIGQYASQGSVDENSFLAYYASLSATVPTENDEYFVELLKGCWAMNSSKEYVSAQRLETMEDTFYEKIRQKTRPSEDEGKILVKLFRFFDADGSGTVNAAEFQSALERLGCTFSPPEIRALFHKYNPSGSGKLAYEELSSIFAVKGAGTTTQFASAREVPFAILDKIKKELLKKGLTGVRNLNLIFQRTDMNKSGGLDRQEFEWGLRENGHQLSGLDLDRLFKYFDKNHDGTITYEEFMRAIRGDLTQTRKNIIECAFRKLDITGDGVVNLSDMREIFNVSYHPEVRSGKKNRDQVLSEYLSQWDTLKKDGVVTLEEFIEYYCDLSASIDRDDVFVEMVKNEWNLA